MCDFDWGSPFLAFAVLTDYLFVLQFGAVGGSSPRGFTLADKTFDEIRDATLASGQLYEDPDFPTDW